MDNKNEEFDSLLRKVVGDLTPRVDYRKTGLTPEMIESQRKQRPYELSSSPDYTDWGVTDKV